MQRTVADRGQNGTCGRRRTMIRVYLPCPRARRAESVLLACPGRGRQLMHDEGGATAVEFSLIATLLFMLLFGILHFGLAYHRQQGIHAAAREGARLASLGASVTDDEIALRVRAAAPAFIASDDLLVEIEPGSDTSCEDVGDLVEVRVAVNDPDGRYQASIPGVGVFTPEFDVTATFMCEAARTS